MDGLGRLQIHTPTKTGLAGGGCPPLPDPLPFLPSLFLRGQLRGDAAGGLLAHGAAPPAAVHQPGERAALPGCRPARPPPAPATSRQPAGQHPGTPLPHTSRGLRVRASSCARTKGQHLKEAAAHGARYKHGEPSCQDPCQGMLRVHRVIERFGLEGIFKDHLVQPPAKDRDIFHLITLPLAA